MFIKIYAFLGVRQFKNWINPCPIRLISWGNKITSVVTDFRDIEIHNFIFQNNFYSLEILKKNSHRISFQNYFRYK